MRNRQTVGSRAALTLTIAAVLAAGLAAPARVEPTAHPGHTVTGNTAAGGNPNDVTHDW